MLKGEKVLSQTEVIKCIIIVFAHFKLIHTKLITLVLKLNILG